MTNIPTPPPNGTHETAVLPLRFEDVTEDGRLVLEALPNALGPTIWRGVLARDTLSRSLAENGIIPILTRFVLEGTAGPFSAEMLIEAKATYRIAFSEGDRVMLEVWVDLFGAIGSTYGSIARAGERTLAGKVFAEHVFTRPFAPPGQRRLRRNDLPALAQVAEPHLGSPAPEAIAAVPAGAQPLEPRFRVDPLPITFGIVHTDSNMHVNSLAYLRLFEEAALRRSVSLGRGAKVLGRFVDIVYRKPCMAGDVLRVLLQAFDQNGRFGVAAVLVDGDSVESDGSSYAGRPRTYARMLLDP